MDEILAGRRIDEIGIPAGGKPLHGYIQQNVKDFPDTLAYILYGRAVISG